MASAGGLSLTSDLVVQGLIGLFILLWAVKDAIPKYREMKKASHPDPMVGAMSMAWDRDMQERMLQIMERMAVASEVQAKSQTAIVDQRRHDMNERIDDLMKALERKEDQIAAMIVNPRRR